MLIDAPPHHDMPPWLPLVVANMVLTLICRTPRERAVLNRLTHNERMRHVWKFLAGLETKRASGDDAMAAMFGLAYLTAVERRAVGLIGERERRIKAVGWGRYFTSAASLDDDILVSHMPDDPVAKRMQLTLSAWFTRTYGGPHLSLVQTITEVALDRPALRMAGRLPHTRKRSKPKLIRATGC